MSAGVDVDEEKATLSRLLGVGASPVATPEMLVAGLQWVITMIRAKIDASPIVGRAAWMTAAQLEKHFAVGHSQMQAFTDAAKTDKRVRKWIPETVAGVKGNVRYNVADFEARFLVSIIDNEKQTATNERKGKSH